MDCYKNEKVTNQSKLFKNVFIKQSNIYPKVHVLILLLVYKHLFKITVLELKHKYKLVVFHLKTNSELCFNTKYLTSNVAYN